jgi:hypothetical protein
VFCNNLIRSLKGVKAMTTTARDMHKALEKIVVGAVVFGWNRT